MSQTGTSSNNNNRSTRFASQINSSGPKQNNRTSTTNRINNRFNRNAKTNSSSSKNKELSRSTNEDLLQVKLQVGVEPEEQDPLKKNYHELVQKNPNIDTVQRWIGKAGEGLNTAKEATGNIFGSLGGISKLGLKKSTSNPTATTLIAGGGSAVAGLLSVKSLISTFKHFADPKTGSWLLSGLQAIIQGGVAVGLGAPFFGKGEKSPFISRVDGEDVVEVKALLGGVGASALVWGFNALSKDQLPIVSKIPGIKGLAGGIARDLRAGIDNVTTGATINQQGQGPAGANPGLQGLT